MTFDEIKRQSTYVRQVQFGICDIGDTEPSEFGFCQVIIAKDEHDNVEYLNYFFKQEELFIDKSKELPEWYNVKWVAKGEDDGYFKCYPVTPPLNARPFFVKPGKSKMDERNLGKCRHGILCAVIKYHGIDLCNGDLLKINRLAEFSMTGEIHEAD